MPPEGKTQLAILDEVAQQLCKPSLINGVLRPGYATMPSLSMLQEIMERLRSALFPGYFVQRHFNPASLRYHLAANLDSILQLLSSQIVAGLCFACTGKPEPCADCTEQGQILALDFMRSLPKVRDLLATDAQAAYEGDPAASSMDEAIFCYPSMTAMFHHRIAHELYARKIPIIPRIIAEMAHSETGIDIHPGASIARDFFIDHGTGVVIGETCIIGRGCRLYQGVTLGALSFPKNPDGTLIKGIPRHPILEDNVTVYAGATILGRITIGKGALIGGNAWITEDVEPGMKIVLGGQSKHA